MTRENKTPAFATAAPLRSTHGSTATVANHTLHNAAVSPRRVVHLSVSTPRSTPRHADPSRRSKRDPTFRKLQRRHRQGPAEFRRAREAEQNDGKAGSAERSDGSPGSSRVVVAPRVRRPRFRKDGTPLSELSIGQRLPGVAQNTVAHGVFVDVGATVDGLVHVRDMAIDFVHEPDDLVRRGDRVTVWVKYVDAVSNVLGLSMLRPARGGFEGRVALADLEVGARLLGVVHRVTNYGAYIDVGAKRSGFVHVTALWGRFTRDTLDNLRLGTEIWVHVAHVDVVSSHIVLRARAKNGDRLDEVAEVEEESVMKTRGWLFDDDPRVTGQLEMPAPLQNSTKIAVQRPGEELVEDDDEVEDGDEDGIETALSDEDATAEETEEEENENDEFAFAKDIETLQVGGVSIADVEEEEKVTKQENGAVMPKGEEDDDDDDDEEFAFAEESTLMQAQGGEATLGQLTGLIDSETELVGFEKDDDLLTYLRGKQARNKTRDLSGEVEAYDEDEDEDEDEDDFVEEDDDEDEDEDEEDGDFEAVDEIDVDGASKKDLRSLLHGDVDF